MKSNGHATPEAMEREADLARAQVHSTIDAIASKLTPGQLMDQSIGYLRRSLPAEFTSQLGRTVRDNPLPVTLVGIGLAWLMLGGRSGPANRETPEWASATPEWAGGDARDDFGVPLHTSSTTGAAPARPTTTERLGAKAGDVAQTARDKAAQAAGATREAAQRVGEGVSQAGRRIADTAHRTGQRVSDSAARAGRQLGSLGERSRQQMERARDSAGRLADEQPLVLAALGVAVGAVLGAMLPPTRHEDRLLGDTRDDLLGSARGTLREQAEQWREPAERVMEHATQELSQAAQRLREGAGGAGAPAAGSAAQWSDAARATPPAGARAHTPNPLNEPMYEGDGLAHSTVEAGGPFGMGAVADDAARRSEGLSHSTAEAARQPRTAPDAPDSGAGPGGPKDVAG